MCSFSLTTICALATLRIARVLLYRHTVVCLPLALQWLLSFLLCCGQSCLTLWPPQTVAYQARYIILSVTWVAPIFSLSWIVLWYTYLCKLPFLSFCIPWNLFPQTILLVIRSGQKNEWIHTYTYCPAVLQKDDNKSLVSIWQQFFRQEFLKSYFKKVEILEFKDWNGGLFRGHLSQLPQECKDALPPFHNSSCQNIFVRSYVVKCKRKIQPHKNMQL